MKLQVPLTMAAMLWTWLAARAKPSAWTIGIPPPTLPSNATARSDARAWAKTCAPCSARSALLAVTTCLPAARAASTYCKAGSVPPIVSMMMSTSRIVDQLRDVGREPDAVERNIARLFQIADRRPGPADALAGAAGDPVGVIRQAGARPRFPRCPGRSCRL